MRRNRGRGARMMHDGGHALGIP
eukprot:COSAG05_NODE_25362_length_197_cov_75.397959_1_plen_22_part_10